MLFIVPFVILTGGTILSENPTPLPSREEISQLPPDGGSLYNRLIFEKSPYLLQHATNPVDWYSWSEEAFAKARKEDKPIFLSIGYATCHWCHVMEKSCFIDTEVAKLLNSGFVCIKVDREERPDIDHIYMSVCQAMTGSGGWPMTMILTPELKPFFAGTFFAKVSTTQRIGLMDLLPRIQEVWKTRREEVERSARKITEQVLVSPAKTTAATLNHTVFQQTFDTFKSRFDRIDGGFGNAPKFPTPHQYRFLLRYAQRTGNADALEMVVRTLEHMRRGGIYDQIGGGFHRYSTDAQWLTPHFEKMLYDQALIAMAYLECYQMTGNEEMLEVAEDIFHYVLRDMVHPDGGFFSAEDADSEGEEGKFYVWTLKELQKILSEDDLGFFVKIYQITEKGSFIDESSKAFTGANIPHLQKNFEELARDFGMTASRFKEKVDRINNLLFQVREKRIHPLKDTKILTDWNGLMIAALAKGYAVTGKEVYREAAGKAVDFLWENLSDGKGNLLKRYRDGHAGLNALLSDYAFVIYGLIELYQAGYDIQYLEMAINLTEISQHKFLDREKGGFFQSEPRPDLVARLKEIDDGAIPSGNSIMMDNLIRLGHITGNQQYLQIAEKMTTAFASEITHYPTGHTQMLMAFDIMAGSAREVVIVTNNTLDEKRGLMQKTGRRFLPRTVFLFKTPENSENLAKLCPFTESRKPISDKTTFFLCKDFACLAPITDEAAFFKEIDPKKP